MKPSLPVKSCRRCGQEFDVIRSNWVNCPPCRKAVKHEASERSTGRRKGQTHPCMDCGRLFKLQHGQNIRCRKCRAALARKRERPAAECKAWKQKVFQLRGMACERCGEGRWGLLCAHHVKPWSRFPQSRFDPNNGRILCYSCHEWVHGVENLHGEWLYRGEGEKMNIYSAIAEIEGKGGRLCFNEQTEKLRILPSDVSRPDLADAVRAERDAAVRYAKATQGFLSEAYLLLQKKSACFDVRRDDLKLQLPPELVERSCLLSHAREDDRFLAGANMTEYGEMNFRQEIQFLFDKGYVLSRMGKSFRISVMERLDELQEWLDDLPSRLAPGEDPFKDGSQ